MLNKKSVVFFLVVVGLLFFITQTTQAANLRDVIINEVSWVGSSATDTDEWLELRNASDTAINLQNWTIENAKNNTTFTITATSSICSTTTIPAGGYFLISNFTSASSTLNVSSPLPQCATDTALSLNNNYSLNGPLTLKEGATVIDDTPASSTTAWPGGAAAPATSTMARNFAFGNGASTTSWHTSIIANNFDTGISDKGTPGYYNGYLVTGQTSQLNGNASGTIYILAQNHTGQQTLAQYQQSATGTYTMHLFGSATSSNPSVVPYSTSSPTLYDFFAFRDTNATPTQYNASTEPRYSLNNDGSGYNSISGLANVNFPLVVNPTITGITSSTTHIGDIITISGTYFGDSTSTSQGKIYFPPWIDAANYIQSWSSTSISVSVPQASQPPSVQTGTLSLRVGNWAPFATSSITVKPRVSSAAATTKSIKVNFDSYVDGASAGTASNYTLQSPIGTSVSLTSAWADFRGNIVYIKGISLTLNNSFSITASQSITSIPGTAIESGSSTATGTVMASPGITSVSPNSGGAGTAVTVAGTNFGAATGTLYFSPGPPTGGTPPSPIQATVSSWINTSITTTVPSGAKTGPLFLITNDGTESDFTPNAFFNVLATSTFKVLEQNTNNPISSSTARIVIGSMGGPKLYYVGDSNGTSYSNGTTTVPSISSEGFVWTFDNSGNHISSIGQQLNTGTTTVFTLATSTTKISGLITNANSNRTLVIFADPMEGTAQWKEPIFVITNANGTTSYNVGLAATGTYIIGVEDPGFGGTASSSPKIAPAAATVNASTTTAVSGINFAFDSATARIRGKIEKAGGASFAVGPSIDAFHIWAYQPVENGLHASAMPDQNGYFDLYVNPGVYIIGVGGPDLPSPVEKQIEVKSGDTNFGLTDSVLDTTLIIKAPEEYIEGRVTDSSGNAVSGASVFAWREGAPGGGQAFTNSSGVYKLYVSPGTYTVEGFAPQFGKLTARSNIEVSSGCQSSSACPTVDFGVSSDLATISGTVTKNDTLTSSIEIWVTVSETGYGMNRTRTSTDGAFSLKVPYGSGYYIHAGEPGKGEIYRQALSTFNSSVTTSTVNISLNTAIINVRISPGSAFSQAFVEARNTTTGKERGFSDKDVSATTTYRQYSIEVPRPSSETWVYQIEGGIPGYGPLAPTSTSIGAASTSATISLTLGNIWTVSGAISDPDASATGNQAEGAFVWAAGSTGHGGGQVSDSGTFSFILKEGTYDFGVDKKNYTGNVLSGQSITGATTLSGLTLSSADLTIAGIVYKSSAAESGAWVWAVNGSGGWAGDESDGNGNYNLKVTSGTWQIKAVSEGYESSPQSVALSSGTSTVNITLSAMSGYTVSAPTVESIVPKTGGIVKGEKVVVDAPSGALSSQDTNTGRISIQKTTSVPQTNGVKPLGNAAYDISVVNSSGTAITVLNDSVTITLTYTAADLTAAGLSQASAAELSLGYWDSTANTWTSISTNAATTSDGSVTYTGATNHLSSYAPLVSSGSNPPPTPANFGIAAGDRQLTLSWTASTGATKYYIYKKSGELYPYLAQTINTSYTDGSLTNGTTYYYRVSALNADNDESTSTEPVSGTPTAVGAPGGPGSGGGSSAADVTSPSISQATVKTGETTATISWKTDEASISWLRYGTSTIYGLEIKTTTSTTSHSLTITGLSASTTYHYQIKAKDSSGNIGSYTDKTFTTLALGEKPKIVEEVPAKPKEVVKPISEMTAAELRTEITRILVLISQIQAQLGTNPPAQIEGIPTGFTFKKNLSSGMSGPDIVHLKVVLEKEGCLTGAKNTKYFASKTSAGVKCLCEKYRTEISQTVGYEVQCSGLVGKGIRVKLNQLLAK